MASDGLAPRLLAYDVLRAVDAEDAYANLELARRLRTAGLPPRDAALSTELVGGTLRLRGAYDAVIDQLARGAVEPPVRDALRLGAHQLLSTRVSTHAAVSTTVSLVRRRVGHRPTGLVNAVLRKVAGRPLDDWLAGASLDVRFSHPAWVVEALAEALDRPAELEPLLAADNERPAVTLVARPGRCEVEELGGTPTLSPIGRALDGGDPAAVPAVREGRAGVQDAGSQLVALALTRAAVPDDRRWLDLCAGPGGKAALLAAVADQRGVGFWANERQPHRAELVARLVPGRVLCADGTRPAWPDSSFDRVLVDAPCTGLGALRRRPEARWRRRPDDVAGLVDLQRRLLGAALDSARPGGVVGYATCSPVKAETADVVRAVLAERTGAALEDATALLPEAKDAESAHLSGALQLWPHRHRTDAMFLALLRRTR
ncbi:rRNA cytosine-C5-methyltransferase [Nocardioides mangrovicus]|uniref:rRNA cytosine-C5-methyltransferase n=1 Tax=Nocardioides mangrovicus TaxID=2478913 RepID=A0A3L8P4Y2_9ACTN|nr:RsmB/NOP family class I SAM-dependent RNA methyltransferase [Nocardioides mangrovicus]RLV50231.1 rRNA cytosine-C5-methyltransferase [Nocardioides mangrovicus]